MALNYCIRALYWKGIEGVILCSASGKGYLCPVSSLRWSTLLSLVHYGLSGLPIRKGIEGLYYARRAAMAFTFTVRLLSSVFSTLVYFVILSTTYGWLEWSYIRASYMERD
jgi:hypothetical protein